MTTSLPDVSLSESAIEASPLTWVGMQGIDLPILIEEPGYQRQLHARVDSQVDLPLPHQKGIHMSRLHHLLDGLSEYDPLTPRRLKTLLQDMIDSHRDCESRNARLRFQFDLLTRRPALISESLGGWASFPVSIEAACIRGAFSLQIGIVMVYSSTCPCSAALTREAVAKGFEEAFSGKNTTSPSEVARWLQAHATLATPHSQRSEAHVTVEVHEQAPTLGLLSLIRRMEDTIRTPVQTAVKRVDEQAFAQLNGQNLMFVEDATRRLKAGLAPLYPKVEVHVKHLESLHAHDAVAWG